MSAPAVPRDETAGAGPRARLAGLIGAALRGLGRVHRRHGAALGVVLLVGLFAGLVTVLCGGSWEASMLLGATFTATGCSVAFKVSAMRVSLDGSMKIGMRQFTLCP